MLTENDTANVSSVRAMLLRAMSTKLNATLVSKRAPTPLNQVESMNPLGCCVVLAGPTPTVLRHERSYVRTLASLDWFSARDTTSATAASSDQKRFFMFLCLLARTPPGRSRPPSPLSIVMPKALAVSRNLLAARPSLTERTRMRPTGQSASRLEDLVG